MTRNSRNVIPLAILAFCVLGCSFLSDKGDKEVVYAPTEVGTPTGESVRKDIGPAGGTLSSPDGRLTLTVPQNALTETLPFSIQPITNKAGNGLGLAYRLEPDGKTFATPLEISFLYDEKDLEGTVPEAFMLAYQDKSGAWHAHRSAKLDQGAKTLKISTTHFSDQASLSRIQLSPSSARLKPCENQVFVVAACKDPGFLDKLLSRPQECDSNTGFNDDAWQVIGQGTYESAGPGTAIYTAPGKKPSPNIAWLQYSFDIDQYNENERLTGKKEIVAKITIDSSYTAAGQSGALVFSGNIPSLYDPFTVNGQSMLNFKFDFTPNSGTAEKGTVAISGSGYGVTIAKGTGTYTVEGIDSDRPKIAVTGKFTGTHRIGSASGDGTIYIDLVPLEEACNK